MQVACAALSDDTLTLFCDTLDALGPFEPSPHLAVAVSGGSDSMALALLAHACVKARNGRITALTVDHGLRPEATCEAAQVAAWMKAYGITHVTLAPAHTEAGNNLMNAARQWRYDALSGWCREHHVLHCLIAHHAADQRETIALHTARGDTEDGPSGMRRVRNYQGVRFLRPLLGFEKETLRAYLAAHGAGWIEDPTNDDLRFARNRMRRQPLPAPVTTDRAAREWQVATAAVHCVRLEPEGTAALALRLWRNLPEATATQLLADLIRCIGGETSRPRRHKTLALATLLSAHGNTARTLGGCSIEKRGDTAVITRETTRISGPFLPAKPLAASPFW